MTIITHGDANDTIVGSGKPVAKTWDIAGFDRVQLTSTFRATITKGTAFTVSTTADDNVLPHIRVVKEGTTLKISLASGRYQLKSPLTAEITLPTLAGVDFSGASKGTLKGFQSERELSIKLSGSSGLDGGIAIENGDFKVDGASNLALVGSAQTARLSADGSSHFKFGEFILKKAQIDLSGTSEAQVSVKSDGVFKATLSGSSTLKGSIQAKEIGLELSGASHARFDGAANDAKLHASGSSVSICLAWPFNTPRSSSRAFPWHDRCQGQAEVRAEFGLEFEVPGRSRDTRGVEIGGFVDLAGAVNCPDAASTQRVGWVERCCTS